MSSLAYVQQCLTRYGMTTYITTGNIGALINIMVFSQSAHRRNPGSMYVLSTALCAIIGLNIAVIPLIYGLDHPDPLTTSYIFCKVQFYFRHTFNQMMRTFFVLACADRFVITSTHARIRSFSQYKIAIRVISSVILFWFILGIFPTLLRTLANGKCEAKSGINAIVASTYILIVTGMLPLFCMGLFSVLLKNNLMKTRARVQPTSNINQPGQQRLHKRDRDMLRMLLVEVIVYTSTTLPLTVVLMYKTSTQNITKSSESQQIESFVIYFINAFLLFANNSFSFWIYICASRSFRLEVKKLVMKCYSSIQGK